MQQLVMNFSLVMPVKNGSRFIPAMTETVSCIMRSGDELIIVDDESEDGTYELLEPWVKQNSQARLIPNRTPGIANALNLGIAESTHDWIARIDVDDSYVEQKLFTQEQLIDYETVAVFSDYTMHTESGRRLAYIPTAITPLATALSLVSGSRTPHPSVVFRKEVFYAAGGYRQSDFPCEDLSLWLRMGKMGYLRSAPEVLLRYRVNKSGITSIHKRTMRTKKNEILQQMGLPIQKSCKDPASWLYEDTHDFTNNTQNKRDLLLLREIQIHRNLGLRNSGLDNLENRIKSRIRVNPITINTVGTLAFEKLCLELYRTIK